MGVGGCVTVMACAGFHFVFLTSTGTQAYRRWSARVMAFQVVQAIIEQGQWVAKACHLPRMRTVILWIFALGGLLCPGPALEPIQHHGVTYQVACIVEDSYGLPCRRRGGHLQAASACGMAVRVHAVDLGVQMPAYLHRRCAGP